MTDEAEYKDLCDVGRILSRPEGEDLDGLDWRSPCPEEAVAAWHVTGDQQASEYILIMCKPHSISFGKHLETFIE